MDTQVFAGSIIESDDISEGSTNLSQHYYTKTNLQNKWQNGWKSAIMNPILGMPAQK